MSEGFDKTAALATGKTKVGRLILENIGENSFLYNLVEDFVNDPSIENALRVEGQFQRVADGLAAISNSINSLAKTAISDEASEEVDVTFDENGARLL